MNQNILSMRVAFFALALTPFAACDVSNTILSTNQSDGSTSPDDAWIVAADAPSTNADVTIPPSQRPAIGCSDLSCGPGTCVVTDDVPSCSCPDGFASSGSACLACTDVASGGRIELPALTRVSLSLTVNGAAPEPKDSKVYYEVRDSLGAKVAASGGQDIHLPPGSYDLYRVRPLSSHPFVEHWVRSFTVGTLPLTIATDEKMMEVKLEFFDQNGQPWPRQAAELIAIGNKGAHPDLQRLAGSVQSVPLVPGNYVVTGAFRNHLADFRVTETSDLQPIKLTIPLHKLDVDFFVNGAAFVGKASDLYVGGAVDHSVVAATPPVAGRYTFAVPAGRWILRHGGFFSNGSLGVSATLADVEVSNDTTIKVQMNPVAVKGNVLVDGQPLQSKGVRIGFTGLGSSIYSGNPKVDETGALTATLLPGTYSVYLTCSPPGCTGALQGSTRAFEVKVMAGQPDLNIDLQTGKLDVAVTESGKASANGSVSVGWEDRIVFQSAVPVTPGVPASFLAGAYQPQYQRLIRDPRPFSWRLDVTLDPVTVQPGQTTVIRRDLRLLPVGVGAGPDAGPEAVWAESFRKLTLQGTETVGDVRASVPPDQARGFEVPAGVYKFGLNGYAKPLGCFRVTN